MATVTAIHRNCAPDAATLWDLYSVSVTGTAPNATPVFGDGGVICICNRSSVATSWRIAISRDGATAVNADYIGYDVTILGTAERHIVIPFQLPSKTKIRVYNTLATLSFTYMGREIS